MPVFHIRGRGNGSDGNILREKLRLIATPSTCHQFKANADTMYCLDTPAPAY